MFNIVEGLIIGVGAGVTTTVILGVWRWLMRFKDRREQITFIRDLVTDQMEHTLFATDLPPPARGENPVSADSVRYALFRNFQIDLQVALSSRATLLTYKEVSSLQKILANRDWVMTDLTLHERKIMPLTIAQSFCDQLQSLCWLDLHINRDRQ